MFQRISSSNGKFYSPQQSFVDFDAVIHDHTFHAGGAIFRGRAHFDVHDDSFHHFFEWFWFRFNDTFFVARILSFIQIAVEVLSWWIPAFEYVNIDIY